MVSFDIASLFTNIPVDETIEIISNHLFAHCMYFEGFDHLQFTKLLHSKKMIFLIRKKILNLRKKNLKIRK